MVHKGTLKNSDCTERNLFCSCLNWKRHQRWWYWKELCTETNLVLKGTLFWKEPCSERNLVLKWTLTWKEPCTLYNVQYTERNFVLKGTTSTLTWWEIIYKMSTVQKNNFCVYLFPSSSSFNSIRFIMRPSSRGTFHPVSFASVTIIWRYY